MTQLNRDIDAQAKVRNMRCSDKSLTDFAEHGAEEIAAREEVQVQQALELYSEYTARKKGITLKGCRRKLGGTHRLKTSSCEV